MSEEINHSIRAHAVLSASGSSRWLNCTPSARLEEKFPNKSSEYAKEGTLAHEFSEYLLRKELRIISEEDYEREYSKIQESEYYSDEMDEHVQVHVDYVLTQLKISNKTTKGSSIIYIEEKVDLSEYIEEGSGTCDVMIIGDGVLEVIDLKYGKGVRVSSEENSQLKLYGLGALDLVSLMYDIHTVKLTIVQPRMDSVSSFEISVQDLKQWAEDFVIPRAELAFKGDGEQVTGDWCKFCKAKSVCRKLAEENLEIMKHEFSDPKELSDSEILDIYQKASKINDWLSSISEHVFNEALSGKKWEGYKLVEGRSNRVFSDPEKVEERLIELKFKPEDFTISKLAGIGQIEKLVGKNKIQTLIGDLIIKPPGKPTLAPDSDKRPEFGTNQAKIDFAEEI